MRFIFLLLLLLSAALAACNPYTCSPSPIYNCTSSGSPFCVGTSCIADCGSNYGSVCKNCYASGPQGVCVGTTTACCINWAMDPDIPGNWGTNSFCSSSKTCSSCTNNCTVDADINGTFDSFCCDGTALDVWNCSSSDRCGAPFGSTYIEIDQYCCADKSGYWFGTPALGPKQYCCYDDPGENHTNYCEPAVGGACYLSNSTCLCTTCTDGYVCTEDYCGTSDQNPGTCAGNTASCCKHCVVENNQTNCAGTAYSCCIKGTGNQDLRLDADTGYCIFCTNNITLGVTTDVLDSHDWTCEFNASGGCGADALCDERPVRYYFHNPARGGTYNDMYCNTTCDAYDCNPYIVNTTQPVGCYSNCTSNAQCNYGWVCDLSDVNNVAYQEKCVECDVSKQNRTSSGPGALVLGDYECELACGSAPRCDEQTTDTCHPEGQYYYYCTSGCAGNNCTSYSCTDAIGCYSSCTTRNQCDPFLNSYCLTGAGTCHMEPYSVGCGYACDMDGNLGTTDRVNSTGYCLLGSAGSGNLNIPDSSSCSLGDDCCSSLCIDNSTAPDEVPDTCSRKPAGFGLCGRKCDLDGVAGDQYLNSTGYCLPLAEFGADGNAPEGAACGVGDDCCDQICVDSDGGLWPGNGVDKCNSTGQQACGTLCDFNGAPEDEVIGPDGGCDARISNCTIHYFTFTSNSTTALILFQANISCQCNEASSCNITITKPDNSSTIYSTTSSELVSGKLINSPSITYGVNRVNLTCACPSTDSVCSTWSSKNATVSLNITSIYSSSPISRNHDFTSIMTVRNTGTLGVSANITDRIYNSSNCNPSSLIPKWSNETSVLINSSGALGDIYYWQFQRGSNCSDNYMEYTHVVGTCDLNIGCPSILTNATGGCFQIRECYDYGNPSVDPRYDCFLCSTLNLSLSEYSCPDNSHCCLKGQKFENGKCCQEGFTCCSQSSHCTADQFCDSTLNACVAKGHSGSTCRNDTHCLSSWCDNVTFYCCNPSPELPIGCQLEGGKCRCCRNTNECNSTWYCESFANQCVHCNEETDNFCDSAPYTTCVGVGPGYDPDCCASNSDCIGGEYCDTLSMVCRSCSTKRDYWCPSYMCIATDPDCCDASHPCSFGTCNNFTSTCEVILGNTCKSNSDCATGLCMHEKCALTSFISVEPSMISFKARRKAMSTVTLLNYWNEPVQVNLLVDSQVVRFANRKNQFSASLVKGEVKHIPIIAEGSVQGSYTATIIASDSRYPDVSSQTTMRIVIQPSEEGKGVIVATENLDVLLLVIAYGLAVWKILGKAG